MLSQQRESVKESLTCLLCSEVSEYHMYVTASVMVDWEVALGQYLNLSVQNEIKEDFMH